MENAAEPRALPIQDPTLAQTEWVNPDTANIDTLSTQGVLESINAADQTVAFAVSQAIGQITPVVDAAANALRNGNRLFYIGAGTSGRLGVLDAAECPPTFSTPPDWVQGIIAGGPSALLHAIEGAEDSQDMGRKAVSEHGLRAGDVLIGLSASGSAQYVQAALQEAHQQGVLTSCITCSANSPLLAQVQFPILVETGPEVLTGSTRMKAGTAQKLVLNMISTATMIQIGKTYGNLMVDVKPSNLKLRKRATRLVSWLAECDEGTATAALEKAQWQVKSAILMQRRQLDLDAAQALLDSTNGKLKPLL